MKNENPTFRLSFGLLMSLLAFQAFAWEGFDWNVWQRFTGALKPEIQTAQSGLADLLPLLKPDATSAQAIQLIQQWESKRDAILKTLQLLMGEPTNLTAPPPYAEWLGDEVLETHVRRHLRIASEADDWIPAYLLIPRTRAVGAGVPAAGPSPTMIVLHQTVPQGKEEPCGIRGSPEMAFARELVERGFICLVPDSIGFGERIPPGTAPYHDAMAFYRRHPRWSFFGKMVWDVRRIVDYLETLPAVDARRIGIIGHSHGAYGSILAAAFEPRISAVIASCGFTTLRRDPNPERWSHGTALLPRLGFWTANIAEAPFDWHEVCSLLAPRPFFYWETLGDKIFPNTENLKEIYAQLRGVYGLYGAAGLLNLNLEAGEHSFPAPKRREAYEWLAGILPSRPDLAAFKSGASFTRDAWEAARPAVQALLELDMGPVDPPKLPAAYKVVGSRKKTGYIEKKIEYRTAPSERIGAYLLVPTEKTGRLPGMIVFHQTAKQGKEEAVGHSGKASLYFAPELARRGYIVLAPDSITAGERITAAGPFETRDFYLENPTVSACGKMIQDGRRAIDILQSVPGIDPERIGAIGHSLGAEESLLVAAFDKRVKAAASSCGFAPFRSEKDPGRWARSAWFSYMPRLRADLRAGWLPAWDFDDVIRLIAPRGFFNIQTSEDEIFPQGAAAHPLVLSTRPLWRMYGEERNLESRLDPGPHDISPQAKQAVYAWFDSILKKN